MRIGAVSGQRVVMAATERQDEPRRVRVVLDLDRGSDPVAGTLTADSGAATPFTGWVGLTRAIELALTTEGPSTPPTPKGNR